MDADGVMKTAGDRRESAGPATIFGSGERTDASPSKHAESTYAFLCRVAGPVWDQCRALIDGWLAAYPAEDRVGLIKRLKSGQDRVFTSAFWELYLHEMYRRSGWVIEVEPEIAGVTTRPDFLVSKGGVSYYVEARCTFEGGGDTGAAARLQNVYEAIDSIDSGAFHLSVTVVRTGADAPPTKKLRRELEAWLRGLDPDDRVFALDHERPEYRREWIQDDWHLRFYPIARSPAVRGVRAQRPLGVFAPAEASVIDDITPLREALSEKGAKYGKLKHPLVIAINIGSGFHDDLDTTQALYGTLGWRINMSDPRAEPAAVLTTPGYWGFADRPAHTHIAGVLLAEGFHYGRVAAYAPAFWAHPYAPERVEPLATWRVAQPTMGEATYEGPAVAAHAHFELPEGWPIGEPFPRRRNRES